MEKLSLYIHIPFCKSKCSYCSFISSSGTEGEISSYIKYLSKEMELQKNILKTKITDTIFIGGGTPSILNEKQLDTLLSQIEKNIIKDKKIEYTVECNPESITEEKLKIMKNHGVNRISMGLQSADGKELKLLGRIHNYETFQKSYMMTRKLGFDNVNIDLMFAYPTQTEKSLQNTLSKIINLNPDHISAYSLIIEDNTPLEDKISKGLLDEIDENTYIKMYRNLVSYLEEHGYNQYEISNFAKKGKECTHNIGYWTHKNYLGLGIAAHSLIDGVRFSNPENIKDYKEKLNNNQIPSTNIEQLTKQDYFEETIMLGLRINSGINTENLIKKYSLDLEFREKIQNLQAQNLLEKNSTHIKLTQKGRELCNTVIIELIK